MSKEIGLEKRVVVEKRSRERELRVEFNKMYHKYQDLARCLYERSEAGTRSATAWLDEIPGDDYALSGDFLNMMNFVKDFIAGEPDAEGMIVAGSSPGKISYWRGADAFRRQTQIRYRLKKKAQEERGKMIRIKDPKDLEAMLPGISREYRNRKQIFREWPEDIVYTDTEKYRVAVSRWSHRVLAPEGYQGYTDSYGGISSAYLLMNFARRGESRLFTLETERLKKGHSQQISSAFDCAHVEPIGKDRIIAAYATYKGKLGPQYEFNLNELHRKAVKSKLK